MRVALIAVPILDHLPDGAGGTTLGLHPVGADAVRACPPYGVYLLADVLNAAGHDAVVVDLIADGLGELDPATRCDLNGVDLIGVSATSLAWAAARDVIANVRRARPDVMIIAGGVHPSLFDSHCLATTDLDGVIRGDGEQPLAALCAALETGSDLASVPSLTWKSSSGQIVRNPDGSSIEADDLQRWFPDYDQLPHRAYFSLSLETSRGCAFDCSFCSTPHRRRWRGGEVVSVVDRIEGMEHHFERAITRSVYLVDDEFAMNPPRARAIGLELSRRGLDIGLRYDCRAPDLLRDGLIEALAPHTHGLLLGAECGYDEGLKRIGKGVTCDVLIRAARRLAEAGLAERADFSFILGLPWEGRREVQRTVEFGLELAHRHGVRVLFNWYLQLPGSRLWADSHIRGEAHESWFDSYGAPRDPEVFRSANHLSRDEIFEIAALVAAGSKTLDRGVPRPEFHLPAAVSQAGPRGVPVAVGTAPVLGESTSRSDA